MEKFEIDSKTSILYDQEDWKIVENGIPKNNNKKSFFKYYSLTELSLDSLKNNYVYLSNPKDFNDPFDCNRNLIVEKQKTIENYEYVETLNNVPEIGICSFSENGMEPLLRSHYTNSYRGFCLKFKPDFLDQLHEDFIKFKKVIYSESPNPISTDFKFSEYYRYVLKLSNWSYEKEWRLLCKNPSVINNKYNFNENCIEEVSIGYKFLQPRNDQERKLKDEFEKLKNTKFKNIPLYTVGPHNTKIELQKLPLLQGTMEDAIEMMTRMFK
jgi:hypothetical protein